MSIKKDFISGIKWTSIYQVYRQLLNLLTVIILARLLQPSDLGLMSTAMIYIQFFSMFDSLGIMEALIQKKDLDEKLLSSTYWFNVAAGLCFTLIIFFSAPLLGSIYQEDRLIPVIQTLSMLFVINSLGKLQQTLLIKNVNFYSLTKIEIISSTLGSITGIILAFWGLGVWSLVYQSLLTAITSFILCWLNVSWKPSLTFSVTALKSVSNYSLYLTGYRFIDYLHLNLDYILIGKFLGTQALGYYYLAYRIISFISQNISATITRVLFPTLAKIQDDNDIFRRLYLNLIGFISFFTFPLMIIFMSLSEPFTLIILGSKWIAIVPLLTILSPLVLSKSIATTLTPIYQSKGRTDVMFYWGLVANLIVVLAFLIGIQWGMIGVAIAYTATLPVAYPSYVIAFKLIELRMQDFFRVLYNSFISSVLMLVTILVVKFVLPENLPIEWVLGLLVLAGTVAYLLVSWLINRKQLLEILNIARKITKIV
ncbi:MAG: MOP flippase family protein [Prochloraceae cyanobacterium]|nr:MOP flippase family protein [Prochloraceae cyanobacterium]